MQNFIRDWALWVMQLIPSVKRQLELGPRSQGPVRYIHSEGMPFLPEFDGGISFPQTYCTKLENQRSQVFFTDDVIFANEKTKLFQIVVLLGSPAEATSAVQDLEGIDHISGGHLSPGEATLLVPADRTFPGVSGVDNQLFRAATAEEFAQSDLCLARPEPRGYNASQIWQTMKSKRYVIVRPDRFVYAACVTSAQLEQAAKKLTELFPLD